MTYEEMELFLFGDNADPPLGSWRDEAIEAGLSLHNSGNTEVVPYYAAVVRDARQRMLENITAVLCATQ
jgi:hypothetical protein